MKRVSLLACFVVLAASAAAQIEISITATAHGSAYGYQDGQQYTFDFTTVASAGSLSSDSGQIQWYQPNLFTSVTGTGVAGSAGASDWGTIALTPTTLDLEISNYGGGLALTTPDSSSLGLIHFGASLGSGVTAPISFDGTPHELSATLGSIAGDLGATDNSSNMMMGRGNMPLWATTFTVDSIEVSSASAVPEPASVGLWCALGGLAFYLIRRRRPAVAL